MNKIAKVLSLLMLGGFVFCGSLLNHTDNVYAANQTFTVQINGAFNGKTYKFGNKTITKKKNGYGVTSNGNGSQLSKTIATVSMSGAKNGVTIKIQRSGVCKTFGSGSYNKTVTGNDISTLRNKINNLSIASIKCPGDTGDTKKGIGQNNTKVSYKKVTFTFNASSVSGGGNSGDDSGGTNGGGTTSGDDDAGNNNDNGADTSGGSTSGEEEETSETEAKCADGGGALSLGWIVCPIMSWAGQAAESAYNNYVEPALQIEPQLFSGNNSNTLAGWQTFQNIANIIFAILFLIVIFSQLTGVGIDNYGIKKVLPKLIIVAVLINLSYFICIALIDVSNILGNSLQALFEGLGAGLEPTLTVEDSDLNKEPINFTSGSLVSLGVAGFMVGMVGTIWAQPAVILTLLISLAGVAISVLMLFVLLAAREAAVVVMVIISPIAVVCYALPNTKNLFKKWTDIFKALLILYPICGLLVGGGNYVSALLMSSGLGDNFFTAVTAMVAGIIPIFFIPSLTKSAFAGLGNIGAKIGSFGDKMRGRATQGMTNSRLNQHLQNQGKMRQARLRAGVKKDGTDTLTGKARNRFAGSKLGNAIGYSAALGTRKSNNAENIMKTEAARDWNKKFMTDDDGNRFKKDKNGGWSSLDGKTDKTYTAEQAKAAMEKGELKMASYAQGELNKDKIERAKKIGATGAYATTDNIEDVAAAAMRRSSHDTQESISDTLASGQADVLKVEHGKNEERRTRTRIEAEEGYTGLSEEAIRLDVKNNNNATKGVNAAVKEAIKSEGGSIEKVATSVESAQVDKANQLNEIMGKNEATKEAISRALVDKDGKPIVDKNDKPKEKSEAIMNDVAKSVEANRRATEKQFIDVAAGNDAAEKIDKLTSEQIDQSVAVGSQKLQNQRVISDTETKVYAEQMNTEDGNRMAVKPENAEALAKKRIFTAAAENSIDVKSAPEYKQIEAAAKSKYNKELLESEMARIKSNKDEPIDVGHYGTKLSDLLNRKGELSEEDALKAKAYMRLMSDAGSFGQKTMAGIVASSEQRDFAAKFMSKDSDISSAINVKNPALGQYLREVNNGEVVGNVPFDVWLDKTRIVKDKNGNEKEISNAQFVASDITDKDEDIVRQSDAVFEEMLKKNVYTDTRLSAIYNNRDVYNSATEKVRDLIRKKLGRPFDQAEYDPKKPPETGNS